MSARELADLCADLVIVPRGVQVTDLTLDSRSVSEGGLFLACAGRRTHGLASLEQAIARGVRAVLWEPAAGVEPPVVPPNVFAAPVAQLSRHASVIADRFFDTPSATLRVSGITGTNGKTTTAWLLAQALTRAGERSAYLGTLGVGIPAEGVVAGEYTTADAVTVQRQLSQMQQLGARSAAMEVSSHALDQARVDGVRFRVAAFTNLTRDHLDYHGSMEAYGEAKARLFALPDVTVRVINVDDAFGVTLAERYIAAGELVLTARSAEGVSAARRLREAATRLGDSVESLGNVESLDNKVERVTVIAARQVRATSRGLAFTLDWDGEHAVELPLIGEFNVDNVLTTIGVLHALGFAPAATLAALSGVSAPPGRMEAISAPGRALAIIDYAHTPDALAKALRAARVHCDGALHVVFGCGGDRDRGKRPMMASVAAELADQVVITDDNPRTESPAAIAAEVLGGIPAGVPVMVIHDRAEAIRSTLSRARAGDAVLIAGKGHEDYQLIGTERRLFSDQQVVRAVYAEAA